jgi:DNA-binding CsgD family transcriptional regulator
MPHPLTANHPPWHDTADRPTRLEAARRPPEARLLLTPREQDVLALLCLGAPAKQIARRLGVSEHTVKMHLRHAATKRGCCGRLELALSCYDVPPWSARPLDRLG